MKSLNITCEEYSKLIAQHRIALGLISNVPSTIDEVLEIGDFVYLWRETPKF